jgi:hypothetical protein
MRNHLDLRDVEGHRRLPRLPSQPHDPSAV